MSDSIDTLAGVASSALAASFGRLESPSAPEGGSTPTTRRGACGNGETIVDAASIQGTSYNSRLFR